MSGWNPEQYLKFTGERTQPCRDLIARINVEGAHTAIDLGCGPGNSTEALARRFPGAELTGLDSSKEMIESARASQPGLRWLMGDLAEWASSEGDAFDIVFSNAALQWVPDHERVYPGMLSRVAAGGCLAVQVPSNFDSPAHRLLREMSLSAGWKRWFSSGELPWQVKSAAFYYDLLAPLTSRLDIWETEYLHVMPNAEAIIEWYKGTGMRPYLQALPTDADRERFQAECLDGLRSLYPPRGDGRVLFPFRRLFLISYK